MTLWNWASYYLCAKPFHESELLGIKKVLLGLRNTFLAPSSYTVFAFKKRKFNEKEWAKNRNAAASSNSFFYNDRRDKRDIYLLFGRCLLLKAEVIYEILCFIRCRWKYLTTIREVSRWWTGSCTADIFQRHRNLFDFVLFDLLLLLVWFCPPFRPPHTENKHPFNNLFEF